MKHNKKQNTPQESRPATCKLELLITVVNRKKADYYCDLIQDFGVNMQMTCPAMGTANTEILDLLGIADRNRSVIFSVVTDTRIPEILSAVNQRFESVKNGKGVAFTVPFDSVIGVAVYGFLSDNRLTVKENV